MQFASCSSTHFATLSEVKYTFISMCICFLFFFINVNECMSLRGITSHCMMCHVIRLKATSYFLHQCTCNDTSGGNFIVIIIQQVLMNFLQTYACSSKFVSRCNPQCNDCTCGRKVTNVTISVLITLLL